MAPRHGVIVERVILNSARDTLAASVHQILDAKVGVAAGLEDAAALEGPGDLASRGEEPEHLHGVTGQPHGQDRHAETLARARLVVDEDLGDGKGRFDGESDVADERGVGHVEGLEGREKDLADDEAGEEVEDELPVSVFSGSAFMYSNTEITNWNTYGLGDFHCQKLYGRWYSSSWAFANGTAESPPLEDGAGRWSSATLRSTI